MDEQASRPALTDRGWTWLDRHGMRSLGVAAVAALVATLAFAAADLLRVLCDGACAPAGAAGTLASLAILAGLAAVGHWIGHLMHRTWQERLRLELASLELEPRADAARKRRLALIVDGEVAAIHARGRASLWTGLPVGVASLLILPFSMASFGDPRSDSPYLFPLLALTLVASGAAAARGWILLRAAKRLLQGPGRVVPSAVAD